MNENCLICAEFILGMMKNLEIDSGDGYRTLQMYLIPLNYTIKMVKLMYILSQF